MWQDVSTASAETIVVSGSTVGSLAATACVILIAILAVGARKVWDFFHRSEGKPIMSRSKRKRNQRALRRQFLNAKMADGITDTIEDLYAKEEITNRERYECYERTARALGVWDLARRFKFQRPHPEELKDEIRARLADPKLKEAARLPDRVVTEAKPKGSFRRKFGETFFAK